MTKAQNSFLKAIPDILQELEFNAPADAKDQLLSLLDKLTLDKSIWGLAVKSVLHGPTPEKVDNLIEQLSEQAADNAGTMSKIVGWDATFILLKIYGEKFRYSMPDGTFATFNPK